MKITAEGVSKLTPKAKTALLKKLIKKMDELDGEDFFGTEGWRHLLLGED